MFEMWSRALGEVVELAEERLYTLKFSCVDVDMSDGSNLPWHDRVAGCLSHDSHSVPECSLGPGGMGCEENVYG